MVPPPKRVDSVEVQNQTKQPITFKVTYDDHKDQKEVTAEQVVQPGNTFHFPEKLLDMGSWQAVAPITKVLAQTHGGVQELTPSVSGVVKVLKVAAGEAGGHVALTQSH